MDQPSPQASFSIAMEKTSGVKSVRAQAYTYGFRTACKPGVFHFNPALSSIPWLLPEYLIVEDYPGGVPHFLQKCKISAPPTLFHKLLPSHAQHIWGIKEYQLTQISGKDGIKYLGRVCWGYPYSCRPPPPRPSIDGCTYVGQVRLGPIFYHRKFGRHGIFYLYCLPFWRCESSEC